MQDSDGFIWFGTDAGVCRYDGNDFKTFTPEDGLSDNEIFLIKEDSRKRIWFLTYNGELSYYKNGIIYNSSTDSILEKIEVKEIFNFFFEDSRHRIWFGTRYNGIFIINNNGSVTHIDSHIKEKVVYSVWEDDGKIYGISQRGLITFNTDKPENYVIQKIDGAEEILIDASRKILCDTVLKEIYCPQPTKEFLVVNYKKLNSSVHFKNSDVMGAYKSLNGKKYIYNELCFFEWKSKTTIDCLGLQGSVIAYMMQDWEGGFWITTLNNGVYYTPSAEIKVFDQKNGLLSNNVKLIFEDNKKDIWAIQDGGSYSIINHEDNTVKSSDDLYPAGNYQVKEAKTIGDSIWISIPPYGLLKMTGSKRTVFFPGTSIKSFYISSKNIWISAGISLLHKFPLKDLQRIATTRLGTKIWNPILRERTFYMHVDTLTERIWVGTQKGIIMLENDSIKPVYNLHPYLKKRISQIVEDNEGNLWFVADATGIVVVTPQMNVLAVFNRATGLEDEKCKRIFIDSEGKIWFITNHSLYNLVRQDDTFILNSIFRLPKETLNNLYINNKNVFLATSRGLITFPKNIINEQKVRIEITDIFINNRKIPTTTDLITVPYNQNQIKIIFSSVAFSSKSSLFRYKIDHNSNSWSYTQNKELNFPSLPPGNYNFIIQARNASGAWSKFSAHFPLKIEAPYWQKWWFITCSVFSFILLTSASLTMIYRNNYKKIVLKEKLLESELKALTAQMNPHFIFNTLNTIQRFYLSNDIDIGNELLTKFGKLMRMILDNTHESFITIEDEVEFLKNYLEIEQLRYNNKFSYLISIDENIASSITIIPSMIIQPFVENAIIHGFPSLKTKGFLNVDFTLEDKSIKIIIEDNGVGRNCSSKKNHVPRGINLIRERLNVLNSKNKTNYSLKIIDKENSAGTLIQILLS